MIFRKSSFSFAAALCVSSLFAAPVLTATQCAAQAATTATPRQLGTVKAITPAAITISTDAGQSVTVSVAADTQVVKLAAGSTDLKTAQPAQISEVAVGDRLLATGRAGDSATSLNATRVILMKSGDIAQKNAADQALWRTNGAGGLVSSVDPATGAIVVSSGTTKVTIQTNPKTSFRRFSGDSADYKDAKPATLAEVHVGDQLQGRGKKSADGLTVQADEVLSGAFKNLSGLIISNDAGVITL